MSFFNTKTKLSVLIAIVFLLSLGYITMKVERHLSSTQFCVSCHSMSYPAADLKSSIHYGRLGIDPECGDCHFPPEMYRKIKVHLFSGIRSMVGEYRLDLNTREAYEEHRARLTKRAREEIKSWGSSPCKACHKAPRPEANYGIEAHKSMQPKGLTCVDCHRGIFHATYTSEQ